MITTEVERGVGSGPGGLGLYNEHPNFFHFWEFLEIGWCSMCLDHQLRPRHELLAYPPFQVMFSDWFVNRFQELPVDLQRNWIKCFENRWMAILVQPCNAGATLPQVTFQIVLGRQAYEERLHSRLGVWPQYTCPRISQVISPGVRRLYEELGVDEFQAAYWGPGGLGAQIEQSLAARR